MSKNIVIQEGGEGRQFTAAKLKTALVGGGSCLWIPEDEANLGTKSITEDGTYEASGDGLYGYSSVTVRGIGKVTGKDPVTGEETQITTKKDPQTGEDVIETKVIPSYALIARSPDRLTYNDGDQIDFTGMVVKTYLKSLDPFTDETYPDGIIPDSELDKPVKVAHAGGIVANMTTIPRSDYITLYRRTTYDIDFTITTAGSAPVYVGYYLDAGYWVEVMLSSEPFTWKVRIGGGGGVSRQLSNGLYSGTGYKIPASEMTAIYTVPISSYKEAEDMVLATINKQLIPVVWVSPYNNKAMTDSFTITVNPAPEPDPENGVDAVTGADPVGDGP